MWGPLWPTSQVRNVLAVCMLASIDSRMPRVHVIPMGRFRAAVNFLESSELPNLGRILVARVGFSYLNGTWGHSVEIGEAVVTYSSAFMSVGPLDEDAYIHLRNQYASQSTLGRDTAEPDMVQVIPLDQSKEMFLLPRVAWERWMLQQLVLPVGTHWIFNDEVIQRVNGDAPRLRDRFGSSFRVFPATDSDSSGLPLTVTSLPTVVAQVALTIKLERHASTPEYLQALRSIIDQMGLTREQWQRIRDIIEEAPVDTVVRRSRYEVLSAIELVPDGGRKTDGSGDDEN